MVIYHDLIMIFGARRTRVPAGLSSSSLREGLLRAMRRADTCLVTGEGRALGKGKIQESSSPITPSVGRYSVLPGI